MFPEIPMLMPQLPVPQNVTIFENRAFKGVVKLKEILRVGSNLMTGILKKEEIKT